MGGHALKKVIASRINLQTYNKIKIDIYEKVHKHNKNIETEFLIDRCEKQDFGDLDILYKFKTNNSNIVNLINNIFNPIEIVKNGNVCSFAYELTNNDFNLTTNKTYVQVDFICCENLETAKLYFSYGDLGMIIGQIAHYYCLSFGFDGLFVKLNSETIKKYIVQFDEDIKKCYKNFENPLTETHDDFDKNVINTILSSNYKSITLIDVPEEICKYLNLNYQQWKNGFKNDNEIFNWICSSYIFNKKIFNVSTSCKHKYRLDRKMYMNFIDFLFKDNNNNNNLQNETLNGILTDTKYDMQIYSIQYFNKENELKNMILDVVKKFILKDKFNGKIFLDLGINERSVAQYIGEFKRYVENTFNVIFDDWLNVMSKENVFEQIKLFISNK